MNSHRVSAHITAAADYLSRAIGVAEVGGDEKLADDLRHVVKNLMFLDPHAPQGPLNQPAPPRIKPKADNKDELLPTLAQLVRENPAATKEELAQMLAQRGFISRKGGGAYGGYSLYLMLKSLKRA
jgi:hypothetical protein